MIARIGPDRLLRLAAIAFVVGCAAIVALDYGWLLDPTTIGGDVSNYYAAGQRLNAGHALYGLQAGDRPVPLNPPYWTVPLLSPPPIAVLWRPLAALGDTSMFLWWWAAAIVGIASVAWLIATGSARRQWLIVLLSPGVALLCLAGNVNAFLLPVLATAWWASRESRHGVAGASIALASALKVTPAVFGWWLLVRREWAPAAWSIAWGLAILGLSLLGAGLDAHLRYLSIAGETSSSGVSRLSLVGIATSAGLPPDFAPLITPLVAVTGLVAIWLLRRRPAASFAAAAVVSVIVSPVIYFEQISLLVLAGVPFGSLRRAPAERPSNTGEGTSSAGVADPG